MRRSERVLFGFAALIGAVIAGVDAALAAEAVETAGRGSTLTMFGIGTLVPAILVYAFFRRRELKTVDAGEVEAPPRSKPPKARKARPPKPKIVVAEPVVAPLEELVPVMAPEPPRRLNPAGPNPLELALVAKAMPAAVAVAPMVDAEVPPEPAPVATVVAPEVQPEPATQTPEAAVAPVIGAVPDDAPPAATA